MAREHPTIPKASSSQKQVQRFDGESDDDDDVGVHKASKAATAKKQSSMRDTSKLFIKQVDGKEEPIKFYINGDVEWDVSLDLQERIRESGGEHVDKHPEEGYILVDPRTDSGEHEIASYSTHKRRVVSFYFVEESIKRGKLVPLVELGLFIKEGQPVKFHLHDSLPRDEVGRLKDDILLRGGNPDVEISEARVVIHSKDFRDKLVVSRRWRQIELFETSDWLKSCITMKRFSVLGAGGRLTVRPAPRRIPTEQPGRKPGAPRTEFSEQDDRCLITWMAYKFGKNQAGRQGNQPYKQLVQEADQLWWASRHTWHSWRERYKNKRAHFDPLIIQAVNEREQNMPPGRLEREHRIPVFPESEDDSDEQEDAAQEPEPVPARAKPKATKRKAQDASGIMDERSDPEPTKPVGKKARRVKAGTQAENAPVIKTSASQKVREAAPPRTPSPPAHEPSHATSSPDLGSPRFKSRKETLGEGQEPDGSQSPTQLDNGILDRAVLGGSTQGVIARYNAELARVAADEMELEEGDEEYDDPDVDVVGVTQVETAPINIDKSQSEANESRTESTGESFQDNEIGETGDTVLDTIEVRLNALADAFGARSSIVEAYYMHGLKDGMDQAAAYEFAERQIMSSHEEETTADKCPVDHTNRAAWANLKPPSWHPPVSPNTAQAPPTLLPTSRETSTIPRLDGEKWVYPSEAQFFAAMARKKHNPHAPDMRVIVPIHNAVNERAWNELLAWEAGRGAEACGGVKLVSFKGRPGDRTPKAWFKTLLGYQAPFDRHDWVIDRCGTRMRYVIDFYTGRSSSTGSGPMHSSQPNVSFYLDVRPAIDNWEGVKMRLERFWTDWTGWKAVS
ncbi:unnamed protein product [Rhizoctonia solani]|uniref:holocytochrome-c synthase n=1 Tax=Rhizoctonia solani TaxID=456999 RepID=A0A8H3GVK7_9AGAM|nr:unnamed protein product [Rhizoctonia solani]